MPDGHPPIRSESPFEPPDRDRLRRRIFAILAEAGLDDRADRHDLSNFVLGYRVKSWADLSNDEWRRLCDAAVGWVGITELRKMKGVESAKRKPHTPAR